MLPLTGFCVSGRSQLIGAGVDDDRFVCQFLNLQSRKWASQARPHIQDYLPHPWRLCMPSSCDFTFTTAVRRFLWNFIHPYRRRWALALVMDRIYLAPAVLRGQQGYSLGPCRACLFAWWATISLRLVPDFGCARLARPPFFCLG